MTHLHQNARTLYVIVGVNYASRLQTEILIIRRQRYRQNLYRPATEVDAVYIGTKQVWSHDIVTWIMMIPLSRSYIFFDQEDRVISELENAYFIGCSEVGANPR